MSKGMKQLASEAKKRLKGGYWSNYLERREEDMSLARRSGVSEDYVARTYRDRAKDELVRGNCDGAERELYDKVKAMLSSEEIIIDPIGRLIDESVPNGEFSERYVLELSEAYVKIKRKIQEEDEYNRLIGG